MQQLTDRAGKKALVTGASSGIGRATALLLLGAGWEVWAAARSEERLAEVIARGAHPVVLDLARPADVPGALAPALTESGGFGLLVNAAGYGLKGAGEDIELGEASQQMDVNLLGPAELVRAVIPSMRARGRGTVVMIGSVVAALPQPLGGWYAASKAAVSAWTASLRQELRPAGIRVVEVCPGPVNTGWQHREAEDLERIRGTYRGLARAVARRSRQRADSGTDPKAVARVIQRAADARRPRARYDVGGGTRAARIAAAVLPPEMIEAGLRRYFSA